MARWIKSGKKAKPSFYRVEFFWPESSGPRTWFDVRFGPMGTAIRKATSEFFRKRPYVGRNVFRFLHIEAVRADEEGTPLK